MIKIFVKSLLLTWVWFIQSVLAVPKQCDTKTIGGQNVLENCSGSTEKKCLIVYDSSGGRFVGRCVEGGEGQTCNSDNDCPIGKCVASGNGWRCVQNIGGYGRPCLKPEDCESRYCDTRVVEGSLVSRCVENGNTFIPCYNDDDCQEKRCETFYPLGSSIGYPVCIRGGRGTRCVKSEDCKFFGSKCEYSLDERGRLRGFCVHGGSSDRDCRDDRDCNPPELRCDANGKCVFGGSGVPCEINEDCTKKYCTIDGQCATAGLPFSTPFECSKNEDCKGLREKRCKQERDQYGSVVYKCSADGYGEFCRDDADCRRLPKRCVKLEDGSYKCLKGAPSIAPLCHDDQDCKKYEKVCAPGGICQESASPAHWEHPCRTNNDCRFKACSNGRCVEGNGIMISGCKTDADCNARRLECLGSRCESVFGAGPNECLVDDDCGRSLCVGEFCVRYIGPGVSECRSDEDCRGRNPTQTPIPEMTQVQAPVVSQNRTGTNLANFERGSLKPGLSKDAERIVKTITRSLAGYGLFLSPTPRATVLTFNDVDCGMSRRLIPLLTDYSPEGVEVFLVPVTLGSAKDSTWLNLRAYACVHRSVDRRSMREIVKRLFSKDLPGKTIHDKFMNLIWDEKEKLNAYLECYANNSEIKEWAKGLALEVEKLGIDGTPTTYIIDNRTKLVSDYSGFREDFWRNFPLFQDRASLSQK